MKKLVKIKKVILSLFIFLLFTIGLIPLNVNATTGIVINYDNVPITEGTTTIGKGKMIFDKNNGILTLDNVNLTTLNTDREPCLDIYGGTAEALTIKLVGTNTITTSDRGTAIDSLISLNVEGPGSLTINSNYSEPGYILRTMNSLSISNTNIALTGVGGSIAIGCDNSVTIDKSTINIEGFSYGLSTGSGITTISESTINFKNVDTGINAMSANSLKTTLHKTNINVKKSNYMFTLIHSADLLIDQCNIDASNTLIEFGLKSSSLEIKNDTHIKLNTNDTAIRTTKTINISDSEVKLTSLLDHTINAKGLINIVNSDVYTKTSGTNATAIWAHKSQEVTLPRSQIIVFDKNLEEINNYQVYTSDYENSSNINSIYNSLFTTDGLAMKQDFSNVAKEVHIRVKRANYTAVDAAINTVPKDLTLYTTASVNTLNTTLKGVVRDLKLSEQAKVDKYATDINSAVKNLLLKPVEPTMSEGSNQTINEGNDATFKSNAELKDFIKVLIDGNETNKSNYELKSGSTIVTLKKSYLSTLTEGSHTLEIVSKNGSAKTNFTIVKNKVEAPNTGMNHNNNLFLVLMFISSIGMIVIKRKEMQ
ncbi:MAG: hypothetical protein RR469_05205 [Erysipelotrichaceae bacterium]